MNYLNASDFYRLLKTVKRKTWELLVGNIIYDDFGYWMVGSITQTESGKWAVLDHFASGIGNAGHYDEWDILDPDAIDHEAVQSLCEERAAEAEKC